MSDKKSTATVVTSGNLSEFNAKKMDLPPPVAEVKAESAEETKAELKPEVKPEETHGETVETPEEKRKRETRERWDKLTTDRREALDKVAALEAKVAAQEAKLNPPESVPDKEPDPTQYTDIAKYRDDLKKWERAEVLREQKEAATEAEQARIESEWTDRIKHAVTAIPDFQSTVNSTNVAVPDWVRDAIKSSELGPQILYRLAKDQEEAEKINKMTPVAAVRYIGKLEAALDKNPEEKAEEKPVPKASNAPAPINPLKSTQTNETPGRTSDGTWQSQAAFRAARKKGYNG